MGHKNFFRASSMNANIHDKSSLVNIEASQTIGANGTLGGMSDVTNTRGKFQFLFSENLEIHVKRLRLHNIKYNYFFLQRLIENILYCLNNSSGNIG